MLVTEFKVITILLKTVFRLRIYCSITWLSVHCNLGLCFKLIFQLLLFGSLILAIILDTTMLLVVTSMDFGMRSNQDLMGLHLLEMFARWVILLDKLITMLLILMSDLV